MRCLTASILTIFAAAAFATACQAQTANAPGCGTTDTKFEIKKESSAHPFPKPEPGKALVFFLQDDSVFQSHPRPSTRFGVDGQWIGATQSNSYFYFSIDPGEHHICGEWQNFVAFVKGQTAGAASFSADAGGAYFFVVRDFWTKDSGLAQMYLNPVDPDEAQLLMSKYAFATARAKTK